MNSLPKNNYIRKTISISKEVDTSIGELAEMEFGGNASALIAHCVLQYLACRRCRENAKGGKKRKSS